MLVAADADNHLEEEAQPRAGEVVEGSLAKAHAVAALQGADLAVGQDAGDVQAGEEGGAVGAVADEADVLTFLGRDGF